MSALSVPRPSTTLCLACASSLPPKPTSDAAIFVTRCCRRPICPTCTAQNPRLARYDPCLACLGGAGAVGAHGEAAGNVDAAVRDADVFVLGDDEDDEDGPGSSPSAPAEATTARDEQPDHSLQESSAMDPTDAPTRSIPVPYKYCIQPKDTLVGIALKFHVDGRHLCRLNSLPPSTLSTTPHLLHTRRVLALPPSARAEGKAHVFSGDLPAGDAARDKLRREKRAREVARSRFQTLTKEADWGVVQAYVALADGVEDELEYQAKAKEGAALRSPLADMNGASSSLEVRAVSRYLDDEEWEAGEARDGRGACVPQFPFLAAQEGKSETAKRTVSGRWWTMRRKW